MKKYIDIDILAFLEARMLENTEHYREDFDCDKKLLTSAVNSSLKEEKVWLWMSRPSGTWCKKENDVFIRGTSAHNTWRFYAEQTRDHIVAYTVELIEMRNSVLYGNVYEMDYRVQVEDVVKYSVSGLGEEVTFSDGFKGLFPLRRRHFYMIGNSALEHGEVISSRALPCDEDQLSAVLKSQKCARDALTPTKVY